jgi:membrane protease YdiL (CAAX protease family)
VNSIAAPFRRDPAVSFLMLLPLALLHLSGYSLDRLEHSWLVEYVIQQWQPYALPTLVSLLVLAILWSIGRIRSLELAWRGGATLIFAESLFWAVLLGPILDLLTSAIDVELLPLTLQAVGESLSVHAKLSIAAGAGLYEELLFRVVLLGGGAMLVRATFLNFFRDAVARKFGFAIALFASAILFAAAHGAMGDQSALETGPLIFRSLAGIAFGLLYWFRGLAICAYTHFAYDAILLLKLS